MAADHKTLTRAEVKAELNEGTRSVLGIDADEFLARYRSGDLDLHSVPVLRLSVLARLFLEANNGHSTSVPA
jgi:hypothetical protein